MARGYRDLGRDFALDKCCRAHDHCPVKIKAFSTNYGVTNYHPYTKSHCLCDELFFRCLRHADDEKASAIGNIFFNVLSLQCAQDVQPMKCVRWARGPAGIVRSRPQKRFFLNFFGSKRGENSNGRNDDDRCLQWEEDPSAKPAFVFRMPARKF